MTRAPAPRAPAPRRGGRSPADTLAAELALGVLDAAEREAAEARAAADPDFAAEAAAWSARLHPLSEEAAPVEPSAGLWPRIVAGLPPERAAEPPVERAAAAGPPASGGEVVALAPHRALRRWRWVAGVATGLAAASAAAVVVLLSRPPLAPQPLLVARLEPPAGSSVLVGAPLYTATVDRGRAAVVLTPVGPGPVDARARELWLIARAGAPEAVGVISRDKPLRLSPALVAEVRPGVTLAISLEPQGGSPTGAPTGPVIATGVLSGA